MSPHGTHTSPHGTHASPDGDQHPISEPGPTEPSKVKGFGGISQLQSQSLRWFNPLAYSALPYF